jgi:hypothetical protein
MLVDDRLEVDIVVEAAATQYSTPVLVSGEFRTCCPETSNVVSDEHNFRGGLSGSDKRQQETGK